MADHLLLKPRAARYLLVLAHGAGAGMRHAFMQELADELAAQRVATWRWEFPYMAAGKKLPDRPPVAEAAVRAAWLAATAAVQLPAFAGGKSFGGRMTSQAHAREPLPGVRGLALVCFPLHPPDKPSTERAVHLTAAAGPLLFLTGTRDELAPLPRLRPVLRKLGERAELHVVRGAAHALDGKPPELAAAIAAWMGRIAP